MTKKELLDWAKKNGGKYPELLKLREITVDDIPFLNLPAQYGVYKEQYYCLETDVKKPGGKKNEINAAVSFLRENGNAAAVVENYDTARTFILECVKYLKNKKINNKGD